MFATSIYCTFHDFPPSACGEVLLGSSCDLTDSRRCANIERDDGGTVVITSNRCTNGVIGNHSCCGQHSPSPWLAITCASDSSTGETTREGFLRYEICSSEDCGTEGNQVKISKINNVVTMLSRYDHLAKLPKQLSGFSGENGADTSTTGDDLVIRIQCL